jgi:hypothetical protein
MDTDEHELDKKFEDEDENEDEGTKSYGRATSYQGRSDRIQLNPT